VGAALEALARVTADSLHVVSGVYGRRRGGALQYDGERPGPGWHAHGYFERRLFVLVGGDVSRVRLWKRRWLAPDRAHTCHSRPPDDVPSVWSCSLIVLLTLWGWLDGPDGVERARGVVPGLEDHASSRTARRWLLRALPHALELQQRVRLAVVERSEPRPPEILFPSGLSPPEGLGRRRWRAPDAIEQLWRALGLLFLGSAKLRVPASLLLAEARRRGATSRPSWPL
jgi:hypothetical protein